MASGHSHQAGTLHIDQTCFDNYIASPDVHIDQEKQELVMYYHGATFGSKRQPTMRATSKDGVTWKSDTVELGDSYFRVFQYKGYHYAGRAPG